MPNVTIAIPADLKKRMTKHRDINWSEVARQAIEQKIALLSTMDMLLERSELTEADIIREAKAIKKRVWKKHRKK